MPASSNQPADDLEPRFNLLAPLLAWLLPGLGHFSLGYRRRGIYLLISIGVLFLGGLLIGGVDVIDRRENRWWFYGQSLVGPMTLGIDWWIGQQLITTDEAGQPLAQPMKPPPPLSPDDPAYDPNYRPAFSVSLARINEVGTLFTTLAGMLNLIAILDVIYLAPAAASAAAAARSSGGNGNRNGNGNGNGSGGGSGSGGGHGGGASAVRATSAMKRDDRDEGEAERSSSTGRVAGSASSTGSTGAPTNAGSSASASSGSASASGSGSGRAQGSGEGAAGG